MQEDLFDEFDAVAVARVSSVAEFAGLLRGLRRRQALARGGTELSYRELAAKTGWSHGAVGQYLSGRILPPTDRFDALIRLLGASPAEQGLLAMARDKLEELRRATPGKPAIGASVVPRQLPAEVAGFAGRVGPLAQLDQLLAADGRHTTVLISAVSGTAGVGKTALAVHWAHRVADRFPDGQLYVNLRGFDPGGQAMAADEALRGFLVSLGVPAAQLPPDRDALVGLYRQLLTNRRMLILLDNAATAQQVRPLLPAAAGCVALVTSRNLLSELITQDRAQPVLLDVLSVAEARLLLGNRLGDARVAAEPGSVDDLIAACARLPLALAVVAARAAIHPRFGLVDLAAELAGGSTRLDALRAGDPASDVRAVLSWSYRQLSTGAARLFRLLGLHPGPTFGAAAAASLGAWSTERVGPILAELVEAHLLSEPVPHRYTLHDLLHVYAVELAETEESEVDRSAARHRMLDHYLHTARTGSWLLDLHGPTNHRPPAPPPGVTPDEIADRQEALEWFRVELAVLLACVRYAADTGLDAHAFELPSALTTYLDGAGHWHDWAVTQNTALAVAQRLADPLAQARTHRRLGGAYWRLGRFDEAHTHLGRALKLYGEGADAVGQAGVHRSFSIVLNAQDRHREALDHATRALAFCRTVGDQPGQAYALNGIGWCHAQLGEYHQAIDSCRPALVLFERLGDFRGLAATLDSLGFAYHHIGRYQEAVACYRRAIALYADLGVRVMEAGTVEHLGDLHHDLGEPEAARAAWQSALTIYEELDHPDAARAGAKLADGSRG